MRCSICYYPNFLNSSQITNSTKHFLRKLRRSRFQWFALKKLMTVYKIVSFHLLYLFINYSIDRSITRLYTINYRLILVFFFNESERSFTVKFAALFPSSKISYNVPFVIKKKISNHNRTRAILNFFEVQHLPWVRIQLCLHLGYYFILFKMKIESGSFFKSSNARN